MKQMFGRSNGLSTASVAARADFSTGIASPVSVDWSTKRSFAESTRRSAGIISPAESATRSPGTISSIGISTKPSTLDERTQPGSRLVRPMFLDESRHYRQDNHCGDHDRGAHVAEKVRDNRERQQ